MDRARTTTFLFVDGIEFLLSSWSKCLVRQSTQTNFVLRLAARSLASGEHVTGGLVAARLAAARGLLAAHGWVGGPRGQLHQLFTHCFLTLHQVSSLQLVSANCTHAHDAGALNGF